MIVKSAVEARVRSRSQLPQSFPAVVKATAEYTARHGSTANTTLELQLLRSLESTERSLTGPGSVSTYVSAFPRQI
ncbi:unnamed protein product [Ixodes pacificus]